MSVLALVLASGLGLGASTVAHADVTDGGAPSVPSAPAAPAVKGTIRVPSKIVAQAMQKQDIGVVNATNPDGTPLGARLVGVGKYKSGLKDGDVITSVGATKILGVDTLVLVGMSLARAPGSEVTGRILRGKDTYAVVLEMPK